MIYCAQWRCRHNNREGECNLKDVWLEVWIGEAPVCESFEDMLDEEYDRTDEECDE